MLIDGLAGGASFPDAFANDVRGFIASSTAFVRGKMGTTAEAALRITVVIDGGVAGPASSADLVIRVRTNVHPVSKAATLVTNINLLSI